MKSKLQKREEAAKRIKIEIDSIENLPADQINNWRLRRLKGEYDKLTNYKTAKEKIAEEHLRKTALDQYSIADYLNDMEEYYENG